MPSNIKFSIGYNQAKCDYELHKFGCAAAARQEPYTVEGETPEDACLAFAAGNTGCSVYRVHACVGKHDKALLDTIKKLSYREDQAGLDALVAARKAAR